MDWGGGWVVGWKGLVCKILGGRGFGGWMGWVVWLKDGLGFERNVVGFNRFRTGYLGQDTREKGGPYIMTS